MSQHEAVQVSVVIPAFGESAYLREAVDSVLAQEGVEFELIVIDDGSPVSVEPALATARDALGNRFQFVRQTNAGGAAARNRGVSLTSAPWVAFLDHDDRWHPTKLREQLERAVEAPEAALIYCATRSFGDAASGAVFPVDAPSGELTNALLEHTWIRTLSSVMVRRSALPWTHWFDPAYRFANDIDFYLRLSARHPFAFLDKVLVDRRRHGRQASGNACETHEEVLAILDSLETEWADQIDERRRKRFRARRARHLRAASRAARDDGDLGPSLAFGLAALRLQPLRWRSWREPIRTRLGALKRRARC